MEALIQFMNTERNVLIFATILVLAVYIIRRCSRQPPVRFQKDIRKPANKAPATFPRPRKLSPLESRRIVVDLRTSQVAGLIFGDPREHVIQVFGPPEMENDNRLLYPSQGVAVGISDNHVIDVYVWVSGDGISEPFPIGAQRFVAPDVEVITAERTVLKIVPGHKKEDIEAIIGQPVLFDGPDEDGGYGMDYQGKTLGASYQSLYLCLDFGRTGLRGLWMTH